MEKLGCFPIVRLFTAGCDYLPVSDYRLLWGSRVGRCAVCAQPPRAVLHPQRHVGDVLVAVVDDAT